jgi:asparagine synthetase B (glutamine-hydrolysing)
MCSFLVTNKKIENLDHVNYYLKFRGPDHTEVVEENGWTMIHNLLSITGDFTSQPISKNNVFLVFNGEIYNFLDKNKDYTSDAFFILDEYFSKGEDFVKNLEGEFALVLIDFNKNILYFSSDLFCTKPIYVASNKDKHIGIASYKSALFRLGFDNATRVTPNTLYKLDISSWSLTYKTIYDWNLDQNVDSYEMWETNFFESLRKRTLFTRDKFLVPMSSGYDSGVIVCGLNNMKDKKDFATYSFYGNEDLSIIESRLNNHRNKYFNTGITSAQKDNILKQFDEIVEPFFYGPNPNTKTHEGFEDRGAMGLFFLLKEIKTKDNIKVQLSGQGGDEVTGNVPTYGFNTPNPRPWPNDIRSVFPWGNFYYGANWSYLNKEECIAGSLGIETRYPLLDKNVVQSFINLTPEYKNKFYKAPLRYFMEKYKFPFKEEKLGFNLQIV